MSATDFLHRDDLLQQNQSVHAEAVDRPSICLPQEVNDEALVNAWLSAAAFEVRLGPYDARLAKLFPTLCINATGVAQRSAHALQLLNDRLTGRDWMALDRPTVADVAAFLGITQADDGGISLAPYPAVLAWADRVRQVPGFVALLDGN